MRPVRAKTTDYMLPGSGLNFIRKNGDLKAVTSNPSRSYNCLAKVSLDRFVGPVGVTDEDLKALLDHRVETASDLGGQPRNLA